MIQVYRPVNPLDLRFSTFSDVIFCHAMPERVPAIHNKLFGYRYIPANIQ